MLPMIINYRLEQNPDHMHALQFLVEKFSELQDISTELSAAFAIAKEKELELIARAGNIYTLQLINEINEYTPLYTNWMDLRVKALKILEEVENSEHKFSLYEMNFDVIRFFKKRFQVIELNRTPPKHLISNIIGYLTGTKCKPN